MAAAFTAGPDYLPGLLLIFLELVTTLEWKSWLPWHPVYLRGVLLGEGCQPKNYSS